MPSKKEKVSSTNRIRKGKTTEQNPHQINSLETEAELNMNAGSQLLSTSQGKADFYKFYSRANLKAKEKTVHSKGHRNQNELCGRGSSLTSPTPSTASSLRGKNL